MRSESDICAVRSADGARSLPPPKRSLPLKMRSNSPIGRSASWARAEKTVGPAAAIATKASRDAVVTRGAKRGMGVLVWLKPLNTIRIPASKL